jgi:hypothetical protein
MPINLTPSPSPAATSYYTDQNRLQQKWGVENIRQWSNTDNYSLPANVSSIQYALTLADDEINQFFNNGPYNVPLSPVLAIMTDWANTLAGYWLYTNRGIFEKGDEMGGKLTKLRADALAQMAAYKGGALTLPCSRRWPGPTAPFCV